MGNIFRAFAEMAAAQRSRRHPTAQGVSINNVSTFQLKNNTVYSWATGSTASNRSTKETAPAWGQAEAVLTRTPDGRGLVHIRGFPALDTAKYRRVQSSCP
jgi:hypothetical protein